MDELIYEYIGKTMACLNACRDKQYARMEAGFFISKREQMMFRDYLAAIDTVMGLTHGLYLAAVEDAVLGTMEEFLRVYGKKPEGDGE